MVRRVEEEGAACGAGEGWMKPERVRAAGGRALGAGRGLLEPVVPDSQPQVQGDGAPPEPCLAPPQLSWPLPILSHLTLVFWGSDRAKYHRLGPLNSNGLFLHSSENSQLWKSRIKGSEGLAAS